MSKITYTNKVDLYEDTSISDINKVKARDMNEIKNVVNANDDATTTNTNAIETLSNQTTTNTNAIGTLSDLSTTNKDNLVNAVNETYNKIRKIQCGSTGDVSVSANSYADYEVIFPEPFSKAPSAVTVSIYTNSTATVYGYITSGVLYRSVTATGFKIRVYNKDTSGRAPAFMWIAVE